MIKKITESITGSTLTVTVTCSVRQYAKYPIKVLTTLDLIDKISDKYEIKKTIEEPKCRVGNSKRRDIKQKGIWVFEIDTKEEETKVEPKPKTKRGNTRTAPAKAKSPPAKEEKPKTSIRNRMSKLATKKD